MVTIQQGKMVKIRVRFAEPGSYAEGPALKIQGQGPQVNRPYGVSESFSLPANSQLAAWVELNCRGKGVPSLAATEERYVVADARLEAEGAVRLRIPGTPHNRPYGASVLIQDGKALAAFLEASTQAQAEVVADEAGEAEVTDDGGEA